MAYDLRTLNEENRARVYGSRVSSRSIPKTVIKKTTENTPVTENKDFVSSKLEGYSYVSEGRYIKTGTYTYRNSEGKVNSVELVVSEVLVNGDNVVVKDYEVFYRQNKRVPISKVDKYKAYDTKGNLLLFEDYDYTKSGKRTTKVKEDYRTGKAYSRDYTKTSFSPVVERDTPSNDNATTGVFTPKREGYSYYGYNYNTPVTSEEKAQAQALVIPRAKVVIEGYKKEYALMPRTITGEETVTTGVGISNDDRGIFSMESSRERDVQTFKELKEKIGDKSPLEPTNLNPKELITFYGLVGRGLVKGVGEGTLAFINPIEWYKGTKALITNPKEVYKGLKKAGEDEPFALAGNLLAQGILAEAVVPAVVAKSSPYIRKYVVGNKEGFIAGTEQAIFYSSSKGEQAYNINKGNIQGDTPFVLDTRSRDISIEGYNFQSNLYGDVTPVLKPKEKGFIESSGEASLDWETTVDNGFGSGSSFDYRYNPALEYKAYSEGLTVTRAQQSLGVDNAINTLKNAEVTNSPFTIIEADTPKSTFQSKLVPDKIEVELYTDTLGKDVTTKTETPKTFTETSNDNILVTETRTTPIDTTVKYSGMVTEKPVLKVKSDTNIVSGFIDKGEAERIAVSYEPSNTKILSLNNDVVLGTDITGGITGTPVRKVVPVLQLKNRVEYKSIIDTEYKPITEQPKLITETTTKIKIETEQIQEQQQELIVIPQPKPKPKVRVKQKQEYILEPIILTETNTRNILIEKQQPIRDTPESNRTKKTFIITKTPRKPITPKIIPTTFNSLRNKSEEKFNVLVREKGRFITFAKGLTKIKAFDYGRRITDTTPKASFKVVSEEGDISTDYFNKKFYLNKGVFVERSRYRIDSMDERAGITSKGIFASKSKRTFGGIK